MKSLGVVALGLVCVALFVFAIKNVLSTAQRWESWELDTTRLFTAIEVERLIRDSTAPILARLDSTAKHGIRIAQREKGLAQRERGRSDSLLGLLATSQTARESLHVTTGALETLQVGYDSLSSAFVRLEGVYAVADSQNILLQGENVRVRGLLDSASAIIRRVPGRCRILGVIPCPEVHAGYSLTLSGGRAAVGPSIGVGWRF